MQWALYRIAGFVPTTYETHVQRVEVEIVDAALAGTTLPAVETVVEIEGDDLDVPTGEIFDGDEAAMTARLAALNAAEDESHIAREIGDPDRGAVSRAGYEAECAAIGIAVVP